MTKLIKKKDCKFKNCQIVKGDELIGIPGPVWFQLNKLELMAQQYGYLLRQPAYQAGPSLDGFVRESMLDKEMPYLEMPETPVSDARVQEALAFMGEVDACTSIAEANAMAERFKDLILWCDSKKFVEGGWDNPIDTPQLGNPLKLKGVDIVNLLHLFAACPIAIED